MPHLVGKHLKKIDSKGRVSVPKQFRDALLNSSGTSGNIYAVPHFEYLSIWVFGDRVMDQITGGLGEFDLFSLQRNDMASVILANTQILTFDAEGRTMLSTDLLTDISVANDVLFVGQGEHFEIWEPSQFEAHSAEAKARLRATGAKLPKRPQDKPS